MAYIGNGTDTFVRNDYQFVATASQTTFSCNYTVGYVDVFWNGFKLDSAEYVANNGTTVVLNTSAVAGDKIQILAYNAFNIANIDSASSVFTPSGGLSSTNVQQAIVELDTEKAPLASPALTGTPTINGVNLSSYKGVNLLINSNPLVNQRAYVSGTATTVANQYTLDRWRVVILGQNLTWSVSGTVNTLTAPVGGVEQVIEYLSILGGSYVLSFAGTATALVSQSSDNVTYTTVTPSSGVYTITSGYYVRVRFSSGTFSNAKFELGTIATPYETTHRGEEYSLCQRYYQDLQVNINAYGGAGNLLKGVVEYSTRMRANPTILDTSYVYTNASGGALSSNSKTTIWQYTVTALGNTAFTATCSLDAEL